MPPEAVADDLQRGNFGNCYFGAAHLCLADSRALLIAQYFHLLVSTVGALFKARTVRGMNSAPTGCCFPFRCYFLFRP